MACTEHENFESMRQEGWTLLDVEPIENLKREPGKIGILDGRTLLLVFGR